MNAFSLSACGLFGRLTRALALVYLATSSPKLLAQNPPANPCGGYDHEGEGANFHVVTSFVNRYVVEPQAGYLSYELRPNPQSNTSTEVFTVEGDFPFLAFDYNRSVTRTPYVIHVGLATSPGANNQIRFVECDAAEFHVEVPPANIRAEPIESLPNVFIHVQSAAATTINAQWNFGIAVPLGPLGSVQVFPWGETITTNSTLQTGSIRNGAVTLPVAAYYSNLAGLVRNNQATQQQITAYNTLRDILTDPTRRVNQPNGNQTLRVSFQEYYRALGLLTAAGSQGVMLAMTEALLSFDNSYRLNDPGAIPEDTYRKYAGLIAGAAMLYDVCKNRTAILADAGLPANSEAANTLLKTKIRRALIMHWASVVNVSASAPAGTLGRDINDLINALSPDRLCGSTKIAKWLFLPGPYFLSAAIAQAGRASDEFRYFYWLMFQMHYRRMRPDGTYNTTIQPNGRLLCMRCANRAPLNAALMNTVRWPYTVPQLINGTGYRPAGQMRYNTLLGGTAPNAVLSINFASIFSKMNFRAYEILWANCEPSFRAGATTLAPHQAATFCRRQEGPNSTNSLNWRTAGRQELERFLSTPAIRQRMERLWGRAFAAGDCFVSGEFFDLGALTSTYESVCINANLQTVRAQLIDRAVGESDRAIPMCTFNWQDRLQFSATDNFDQTPLGDFDELL